MAIQLRRGDYEDFDKTKMQEGELAVVTSSDPNTESGYATYVSYASGDESKVKRLLQEGEIEKTLEELGIEALPVASSSDVWQGTNALVPMNLLETMLSDPAIMQYLPQATINEYGTVRFAKGTETAEGEENLAATPGELKYILAETGYWSDEQMSDDSKGIVQNKVIKRYVDDNTQNKIKVFKLKSNNEPTTNASEYPNVELSDICVNESYRAWICQYHYENIVVWSELLTPASSYLANNFYFKGQIDNMLKEKETKTDWELVREITIEEELGAIEITKDDADNSFEYDDIIVIANGIKGTNGANWWVSVKTTANTSSSGLIQAGNANAISSTTARMIQTKIKRMFGLNRYEYESIHKNTGTYVSTVNKGTLTTSFNIEESTKINYVRIHFSTNNTISAGTVLVYGRKRR